MVTDALPVDAPAWVCQFIRLRQEMDCWIRNSLELQRQVPFLGHHDEGAFLASWLCHYQLTRQPEIIEFARELRDGYACWAEQNLVHGFSPAGEVHHQTEVLTQFLARLWHVSPDDRTAGLILDAAEHVGNWVPNVPEWYDWDQNRFVAWQVGTCEVGSDGSFYEVPDHFRLIQLALAAFAVSQDQRYLDLSSRWTRRWAEMILDTDGAPPDMLGTQTEGDSAESAVDRGASRAGTGRVGKVEPFVAAGAIDVLLDLYGLVGEAVFANAARNLCSVLVEEVADPYANPVGALLYRYRVEVGDTSLDTRIMGALAGATFELPGEPVLILERPPVGPLRGVGKRYDMVRWAYRDERGQLIPESSPPPSSLMLAYQITGSVEFAVRALELAASRLALARSALRDGRRHACSGRSVSAVASGHGRECGYGNVTGCFYALAHGAVKRLGHERPAVALTQPEVGLPPDCAALTRRIPGAPATALLWRDQEAWAVQSQSADPSPRGDGTP